MSNAIGSQVINVQLGLGVPSLLYCIIHNKPVPLGASDADTFCLVCLLLVMMAYLALALGPALRETANAGDATGLDALRETKPVFTTATAKLLLRVYVIATVLICVQSLSWPLVTKVIVEVVLLVLGEAAIQAKQRGWLQVIGIS